jgi:hypothetical protein
VIVAIYARNKCNRATRSPMTKRAQVGGRSLDEYLESQATPVMVLATYITSSLSTSVGEPPSTEI